MRKLIALCIIFCGVAAAGVAAYADAVVGSNKGDSHSLRTGATAFTQTVQHPTWAVLYPEGRNVKTSYSTVCLKNGVVSHVSRSFTTSYTRNLLWKIPKHQDVCYITVAAASPYGLGQVVVQVRN